jgi:hypothetical protein
MSLNYYIFKIFQYSHKFKIIDYITKKYDEYILPKDNCEYEMRKCSMKYATIQLGILLFSLPHKYDDHIYIGCSLTNLFLFSVAILKRMFKECDDITIDVISNMIKNNEKTIDLRYLKLNQNIIEYMYDNINKCSSRYILCDNLYLWDKNKFNFIEKINDQIIHENVINNKKKLMLLLMKNNKIISKNILKYKIIPQL